VQMNSHLPAAIPEQALYWWCPDPAAESLTWCQLVLLWQGWNAVEFLGGFSSFAWQRGTFQLIAIHLITLHNILEYM
jgi:hypothetical protein